MTADALLSPNMEHYLKAIFEVVREKHAAKPRDIAHRLDVKQSSVTSAMRWLSEHGFIHYKPFDLITLTDAGETVARSIIRRNEVLCNFFTKVLAVDPVEAERAACAMEHGVSCEIIERFTRFAEFIEVVRVAALDGFAAWRISVTEEFCSMNASNAFPNAWPTWSSGANTTKRSQS
jgi:DtxR family Mn-dependent transcriptional regulator